MRGCQGSGWWEELTTKKGEGIWGNDATVLHLNCGGGYTAVCTHQNSGFKLIIKSVNFTNHTSIKNVWRNSYSYVCMGVGVSPKMDTVDISLQALKLLLSEGHV